MKKKIVYITQWIARNPQKEYPHGWGFEPPVVEFNQAIDPAEAAIHCRELSNDEFECIGGVPREIIDGDFEILGIIPGPEETPEGADRGKEAKRVLADDDTYPIVGYWLAKDGWEYDWITYEHPNYSVYLVPIEDEKFAACRGSLGSEPVAIISQWGELQKFRNQSTPAQPSQPVQQAKEKIKLLDPRTYAKDSVRRELAENKPGRAIEQEATVKEIDGWKVGDIVIEDGHCPNLEGKIVTGALFYMISDFDKYLARIGAGDLRQYLTRAGYDPDTFQITCKLKPTTDAGK